MPVAVHKHDVSCMKTHWYLQLSSDLKLRDGSTIKAGSRLHLAGIAESSDSWVGAWNIVLINGRKVVLRGRYNDACPVDSRGREI